MIPMWNDIETTSDYRNFLVLSHTVAESIVESAENPISIRVSGNWGSGKSSMVKRLGDEL
ncbi:P-loop NTPase fold protein [Selenomonas sp. CM52]|uniref:P-loop NTPase fold protein n=1 Tax=Selenomonas sp. CM52 TaxID=936381 RepID=UPI000A02B0FF